MLEGKFACCMFYVSRMYVRVRVRVRVRIKSFRNGIAGGPRHEPMCEVAVMYLLFVVEKVVFNSFANGFN